MTLSFVVLSLSLVASDTDKDAQVSGLNLLCRSMPEEKRLVFVDTHASSFVPPFPKWTDSHGTTAPDIVALLPGETLSEDNPANVWRNVSLVVEAKNMNHPDPIESKGLESTAALIQLTKNACRMMLAHGSLCCFVIGIYGRKARIFRFDHATAVVSPAFDYQTEPRLLRRFLWRFVHPVGKKKFIGEDDYLDDPVSEDIEEAKRLIPTLKDEDLENSRWVRLPEWEKLPAEDFLMLRVRSLNPRIFSRSTMVREVLRRGDCTGNTLILKRSWKQKVRTDEALFYRRIQDYVNRTNQSLFGIPGLVRGYDLGDKGGDHVSNLHSTRSSAYRPSERSHLGERSDMCLVLDTVGVPLSKFDCTRTLVEAIRDAIKGRFCTCVCSAVC